LNYYERHIGDYTRDTAHLSLLEHGVYSRLLDVYYTREQPLPPDPKAIERLIGARTKEEREAARVVLEEFFDLSTDGWHNKRCDEELARFNDKRLKAKRSADARWHGQQTQTGRNANASGTHVDRNALQTPDSRLQSPVTSPVEISPQGIEAGTPTPRARARANGAGSREGNGGDQAHELRIEIEASYPKGLHRGDHWMLAERSIRTLIEQGEDPGALKAAAAKYCEQQTALGKLGTHEVLRPSTFFGTPAWRGPFPIAGPAPVRRMRTAREIADELDPDNTALSGP
jgi:uncharacterized protein YdaU (DUF1376 family)